MMGCMHSKKKNKTLANEESDVLKNLTNFSPEELERCFEDFTKVCEVILKKVFLLCFLSNLVFLFKCQIHSN